MESLKVEEYEIIQILVKETKNNVIKFTNKEMHVKVTSLYTYETAKKFKNR